MNTIKRENPNSNSCYKKKKEKGGEKKKRRYGALCMCTSYKS
jgi:hypothetical protein